MIFIELIYLVLLNKFYALRYQVGLFIRNKFRLLFSIVNSIHWFFNLFEFVSVLRSISMDLSIASCEKAVKIKSDSKQFYDIDN